MTALCELCGQPMPKGEEMFRFHGYSGDCPRRWDAPPTDPSTTPWDPSTWGFFCDRCMVFFDLVEHGEVRTYEDQTCDHWHRVCGERARYIGYDRAVRDPGAL